jgi:hypothetical protein
VTPTVLFFATSVEVHAPQVLAVGAVLWGFARWRQSGEVPNALVLSLLFLGLVGTHLTGALWAPAFLYLALFGTGRPRLPEHAFAGALALAGGYFVWKVANPGESQGWKVAGSAFAALRRAPNLEYLMKELVLNGAFLFVLPPLLLIRRRLDRTGLVLVLLVFAPQVILFQTLGIEEQGAYFITLFPLLGLLSSLALPRLGRAALPAAAVLLAGQGALAHEFVWQWQNGYRGAEWAEPLIREAGDRGLLLALENWEAHAVQRHSHLDAVSLRIKKSRRVVELPLEDPAQQASALFLIEQSRAGGGLVAVTRSLLDYGRENETVRRFLERLVERFGQLRPGDHPAYFVFPRS